jgi:hypothetical protein
MIAKQASYQPHLLIIYTYVGYTAITIHASLNRNTIFGTMVTLSFSIAK